MGGIATYIREMAQTLVKQGHHVSVVCVAFGQKREHAVDQGVEVFFVPPRRLYIERLFSIITALPGFRKLRNYNDALSLLALSFGGWITIRHLEKRQEPFDLIEVPDWQSLGIVGAFWPKYSQRLLLRSQGTFTGRTLLIPEAAKDNQGRLFLEALFARRVKNVLAITQFMRNQYRDVFGVAEDRITVLPYGFDPHYFSSELDIASGNAPIEVPKDRNPIIGYVGRIEMFKRVDILFEALQKVREEMPQVSVLLLGRVKEDAQTAYKKFTLSAPFHVWHPGEVHYEQIPMLLRSCDIFVFPSTNEPFGRVVAEALGCGVPVIVARGSGSAEIVEDGKTGIVVEPDNCDDLVQAIIYLLSHSDIRHEMGKVARQRIIESRDIYEIAEKQIAFYRKILLTSL